MLPSSPSSPNCATQPPTQSPLLPTRRRHIHVPYRGNCDTSLRRYLCRLTRLRLDLLSPQKDCLRHCDPQNSHRRCDQWVCRYEICLRPPLPGHRSQVRALLGKFRPLGDYWTGAVGHCVDYSGGDTGVQWSAGVDQCVVRELVYVWAERCVLAVYEPGTVFLESEENALDILEFHDIPDWMCYCELDLQNLYFLDCEELAIVKFGHWRANLYVVRAQSVCLWNRYSSRCVEQ